MLLWWRRPVRWSAIFPGLCGVQPLKTVLAARRRRELGAVLAIVVCLVYVNQLLFNVYVIRVHGGSASFSGRYLPAGWFDMATGSSVIQAIAHHFPAPPQAGGRGVPGRRRCPSDLIVSCWFPARWRAGAMYQHVEPAGVGDLRRLDV